MKIYRPEKKTRQEKIKKRVKILLFLILFFLTLAASGYIFFNWQNQPAKIVKNNISKSKSMGVWCVSLAGNEKCYWFDEEGSIIDIAPKPEGSLVIKVEESLTGGDGAIGLGGEVLPEKLWFNFKKIINTPLIKDLMIYQMVVDRDRQELILTAVAGFQIFTSLRFNPEINLIALKQLQDKGELSLKNIDYIDLRVENRVYYK